MKRLTLGSLFDGIGGWQLAAVRAGILPLWSSEIDPFPMKITKEHFPYVLQMGDVTKLDGAELPPVDIICAGSPCQDLSVSGRQAGLAGERSGLFANAIDIVRRMQEATGGVYPRYFVWENVPGAFSSNGRKDFRAVLESIGQAKIPMPRSHQWADAGLVRTEACDIAWRVLDAQFWGVPQHRRRIFLVADYTSYGRNAGEVLFELASVPGSSSEGGSSKDQASAVLGKGAERAGEKTKEERRVRLMRGTTRMASGDSVVGTICANCGTKMWLGNQEAFKGKYHLVEESPSHEHFIRRLTPTECERLQGLPDGWTGTENDAARYKAIGNGMAQPCADFILRRISEAMLLGE